jgi:GT2 family glycosyltransferase
MEEQIQILEIDVSIITVNYNSTELLKNCLESIEKFTQGINFEIVVVDNNSMTGDIDGLNQDFNRITSIKNKVNKGFGAANNQGVEVAKGKYVLLLNNDTILFENSIKKVLICGIYDGNEIIGCKLLNEDVSSKSVYDFDITQCNNFKFISLFVIPKSTYFNKYHLRIKYLYG